MPPTQVLERPLIVEASLSSSGPAEPAIDWESPAGGVEVSCPRVDEPRFIFAGPGDVHWIGQLCDVISSANAQDDKELVIFTCGCQARVPRAALHTHVTRRDREPTLVGGARTTPRGVVQARL